MLNDVEKLRNFVTKVKELREMQKAFFAYRAKSALNASKRLEKEVDAMLEELLITNQPNLF